MSSTNNVYILYQENFHDQEINNIYKKFYSDIGFNVINVDSGLDVFNEPSAINNILKNYDEEVYVIIDNIFIPKYDIKQSIEIAEDNKCLVKPMHRTFLLEELDDEFYSALINNDPIDSFYYLDSINFRLWPLNNAWVIHKEHIKICGHMNDTIKAPDLYDFDYCYRSAFLNKIIFKRSDSYKVNPILWSSPFKFKLLSKQYAESMKNLFGSNFIYETVFGSQIVPSEPSTKEKIFDVNNYMNSLKYI